MTTNPQIGVQTIEAAITATKEEIAGLAEFDRESSYELAGFLRGLHYGLGVAEAVAAGTSPTDDVASGESWPY
jgi:hypothetical protein